MKKAIIVGGSMGGMLAGTCLFARDGAVEILERTRGGLRRAARESSRSAPCLPHLNAPASLFVPISASAVTKRVAYDRAGVAFATHPYDQYSTSWSLLYNLLRDAFPAGHFHAGCNVSEIRRTRTAQLQSSMTEHGSKATC